MLTQTLPDALQQAISELWQVIRLQPGLTSRQFIEHPIYGHVLRAHTLLIDIAKTFDQRTGPLSRAAEEGEK